MSGCDWVAPEIVGNAESFIELLEANGVSSDKMDIGATGWGTVEINVYNERGLVSMGVGKYMIGWFTNFPGDVNEESDGEVWDFEHISDSLRKVLLSDTTTQKTEEK